MALAHLRFVRRVGQSPDKPSGESATIDSGFPCLFNFLSRCHGGGVQTQTRFRKIELVAASDFSWSVKIRVRAMTPTSARIPPLELPASPDFLVDATTEPHQRVAVKASNSALDSFKPGWRISGGQAEGTEE